MIRIVLLSLLVGLSGCGNVVGPVYGSGAGMPPRSPSADAAKQAPVAAPRTNPKMDAPPGALTPLGE
jgi:uncharacterized protein YceK